MNSADVRARLVHALRLDLVGPEPGEPQVDEVLAVPPSRFYLTGFLAPLAAPASQKQDSDDQGDLEQNEAGDSGDEDASTAEPPAARRGQFPVHRRKRARAARRDAPARHEPVGRVRTSRSGLEARRSVAPAGTTGNREH